MRDVGSTFRKTSKLSAFEFFSIIVWKSNRSKSLIANLLLRKGYTSLQPPVTALTKAVHKAPNDKERMKILIVDWGFRLPIASAILTIFYPTRFTIYDIRVCGVLDDYYRIADWKFERMWPQYVAFIAAVKRKAPGGISLRRKDRWLWGKSFEQQLKRQIKDKFPKAEK